MDCAHCGRENPAENTFCGGCGRPLGGRAPRDYTPKHLAERILSRRSALEGERKRLTVLFADIQNSTALAGRVDPEEWHRTLDGFFAILTAAVHLHEGTVNQYTGDGLMALFGAPLAHADHARRACAAALAMRDGLQPYRAELRGRGLELEMRIGLNSGEVVVGKIGDDLRMDYTAQGHTVGLAARVEEEAAGGQIYLTAETARLVEGYFELEPLGPVALRGSLEPLQLFSLIRASENETRLDVSRARGLARLVGRDVVLGLLEAALEQAAGGNGQVVGIVGPPGVGKSRLCLELAKRADAGVFEVHELTCPPHGRSLPLGLARELLETLLGVHLEDEPDVSEVEGALRKLGFPTADWTARVCELLELPGAGHEAGPTDPEERRRSLSAALRRAVQARGARGPNLIVVDDAQWVDAESREVLNDFVDAVGWTRTLLLLDYRPEFSPGWESHSYFREHPLEPLDGDAGAALLEDWLGADASVAALTEPILERTSGTPFFIEEVVRELVRLGSLVGERGAYRLARPVGEVGEIEIPHSVTDAIASRVDALPETDKELVQLASVIGQTGSLELLQRVSGRESVALELSLGVLARASLVLPGGGQTWDFVHPLTREVAYAAQLQEVRVARHVAVAHALEELYADRLGQQAHLIAHHFGAAGQEHRARRWRLRAAMRVSQIQVRRIDRAD